MSYSTKFLSIAVVIACVGSCIGQQQRAYGFGVQSVGHVPVQTGGVQYQQTSKKQLS